MKAAKLTIKGLVTMLKKLSKVWAVALLATTAASASEVRSDALAGRAILFVIGETAPGAPNDDPLVKEYLESKGAQVRVAYDKDEDIAVRSADLVVISSTADSRILTGRYRDIKVPVVTWNAYSFADLEMTGRKLHQDFSVVREKPFHNENHADYYAQATSGTNPILQAARVSSGMIAPLIFSAGVTDPSWGKPSLGADIAVVFQGERDKAAVFSYEMGAVMDDGFQAPARRVGLFLGDNSFSVLSDAAGPAAQDPKQFAWFSGRRLFESALRYAVTPPDSPLTSSPAQQRAALEKLAKGKKLVFVRRLDLPWPENEAADMEQIAFYRSLGFDLTVVDQMESDSRADGADLVIISGSSNKYKLGRKYVDSKSPVIVLEAKAVDGFNMIGRNRNVDYGVNDHKESFYPPENYIELMRPAHPVTAGLPAGSTRLFETPGVLAWSRPPPGATVIATIPNQPEHATMFVYEKGATMAYDHVAPARRALFPMDAPRFDELTPEGLQLYGAMIAWALSPPPEMR